MKPYPFWKELAMEAYLLENEDILKLDEQNFSEVEVLDAEIALKSGRKSGDGRIDILAKYGGEYLGIVEIKLNEINEFSLIQLEDYLTVRSQILSLGEYWQEGAEPKWVGLLVGSSISAALQDRLSQGYQFNGIPIAGMTIKRFRSEKNEVFVISDTYFNFSYSTKDYSKFIFKGKEYNKGRLVNEVVRAHVERNPDITYSELKRDFPDHLQGSFGVIDLTSNAEDIFQRWGHKRHYIKEEEVIQLQDQTISTCNQWNPENIKSFIQQAEKLGWRIELK
ncbi:hypothetical protein [Cyclobacterium roseum]|uniref:hypothetical protein n=1 Tax=Cyclobacterium roseum TaxID=2666137 RepID=UPI00192E91AC|nr:hypothetical protein [Cyclobacterium roseum]